MRNSAGIVADGDQDRDPAGKFKADQSRKPCADQKRQGSMTAEVLKAICTHAGTLERLNCYRRPGRNASKGTRRTQDATQARYSHGEPESLEEYHSRKASHIKSPWRKPGRICTQYGKKAGKNLQPIQPENVKRLHSGLYKRIQPETISGLYKAIGTETASHRTPYKRIQDRIRHGNKTAV